MTKQKQTMTKDQKKIRDELLKLVINCEFSSMKDKLYIFRSLKDKRYKCPACGKNHKTNGWYAFERNNKIICGCHDKEFKKTKKHKVLIELETDKSDNESEYESDESDSESNNESNDNWMDSIDEEESEPKIKIKIKKEIINLFKKNKQDLNYEDSPEVDNTFDIYYKFKPEHYEELEDNNIENNIEYISKYGLEFYDKMYQAVYYNRGEEHEDSILDDLSAIVAEQRSYMRSNFKFACASPNKILEAIKTKELNKDIHEYPRHNCSIYFDLDDKEMMAYPNIHDMYKDFVVMMKIVFDKVRGIKGNNKEFIKVFDPSKLVIHADDYGLNSLHIIYDNDGKTFRNTGYLQQFMEYLKSIVSDISNKKKSFNEDTNKITEIMKRMGKIIDHNVYTKNHSIRTIGSIKKDKYSKYTDRKFVKCHWNEDKQKLIIDKKQKITIKDIVSKERENTYYMKIPHNAVKNSKKFYQPSDMSISNDLAEKFQSYAKDTILASEVNNLFGFNAIRDTPYQCPACGTQHSSNGWYGFMRGNRGYAGCHGVEYKKQNMGARYLFTLNSKECEKNLKNWKADNIEELVIEIITEIEKDGISKDDNDKDKKWSFCDYVQFLRSREPTSLKHLVEYLHETIIHVVDCGMHRLFTKSYLNDGTIGIRNIVSVFSGKDDVTIKTIIGTKIERISLHDLYFDHMYNYCSHDYIDFIPFLDKKDGKFTLDKKFRNTYNLFQGFRHKYEKLDCKKIKEEGKLKPIFDHIDLLADHDSIVSKYIIMWIAFIIQYPTIKNKVALAFYSMKEQTGKNIFWNFIAEDIFGDNLSRSVNSIDSLTQRFNKGAEGKLFTIGNEIASFAKHKDCDKLKSLITDAMQEVEPKNFESYTIHDYNSFVFLTNNFNFLKVKVGNKRLVICKMDDEKIGDVEYFNNLAECMKDNKKLFFNYLANLDLSKFIVTKLPMTEMKRQLIQDNLSAPLKFIQFLVEKGEDEMYNHLGIDNDDPTCIINNHKRITKGAFFKKYKVWHTDEGEYGYKGKTEFFRELLESDIQQSNGKLSGQSGRPWHINIKFSDLQIIANKFVE